MSTAANEILLGQDVADPVGVPGLHGGQRGQRSRSTCLESLVLACRCGSAAMNGGFCQVPLSRCVQRHTAHCGRSISGASARGSFADLADTW